MPKSLVRVNAASSLLILNPLSKFSQTRTPNAHNILASFRLPRTFTTSQRYRRLRLSLRFTNDATRQPQWSRIAGLVPNAG